MKKSLVIIALMAAILLNACSQVVYRINPASPPLMDLQESKDALELSLSLAEKLDDVESITLEGDEVVASLRDKRIYAFRKYGYNAFPEEVIKQGKYFVVTLADTEVAHRGGAAKHFYFKTEKDARTFVDAAYVLRNKQSAYQSVKGDKPSIAAKQKPVPPSSVKNDQPVIEILAPDSASALAQSRITINGVAKSKSGIAEVFVNGQPAALAENGQFTADVLLKVGRNEITVTALDIHNNQTEKQLVLNREKGSAVKSMGPVLAEKTKADIPKITIISPDATRAVAVVAKQISLIVTGAVESKAGLVDVLVNGQQAELDEKGNFSAEILLKVGYNEIVVKANDIFRNQAVKKFAVNRSAGQVASVKNDISPTDNSFQSAKYYALIIAVQNYESPEISALDYPIFDAKLLQETLVNNYTFDRENIKFLQNPDRRTIYKTLQDLKYKVKEKDNLLIFYAGHGYWLNDMKEGFWLPRDAAGINDPSDWIPNSTIRNYIKSIKAKHVLLIADACFSGGIFKTRDLRPQQEVSVEKIYDLPSRKAITSGSLKTVPDRSVFLEYLLKRLKENRETYLDTQKLFSLLRDAVINNSPTNQTPLYGAIAEVGDEGGDFIFIKR